MYSNHRLSSTCFCGESNKKISVIPRWNALTYCISQFHPIFFLENPLNLIHVDLSSAHQHTCHRGLINPCPLDACIQCLHPGNKFTTDANFSTFYVQKT